MKLLLRGHDDRYAVEQLQLALFPEEPMEPVTEPFSGDGAVSSLHTGAVWLTATAEITLHGKTGRAGVQGRNRPVAGKRLRHRLHRLLREQGELELLDGIAVVVAAQEQLHAIASRR